jgi:putative ABC transport system ATP-binding protein
MQAGELAISASSLCKTYHRKMIGVEVLKNIDLAVNKGEFTVLTGLSGSGKTTLLNIIGGIDKPTKGSISVLGETLENKNEVFLSDFRCNNIGFVFQSYNLVSVLTVAENIAFPMEWLQKPSEYTRKRVSELLTLLDLQERADHFSFQLSGGEQQRVAFARALANDPPLLLVDEPTGNLDEMTGMRIIQTLRDLGEKGKTVIVATHDERIFALADQKLKLEEGKVIHE